MAAVPVKRSCQPGHQNLRVLGQISYLLSAPVYAENESLNIFFCRLFFHKNEDSPQECLNSLRQRLRFLCTVSTFSSRWGSKNAFLCCTLVSNNSETHIPDMFVINMVPTFITHTHIHVALMCMHAQIPL